MNPIKCKSCNQMFTWTKECISATYCPACVKDKIQKYRLQLALSLYDNGIKHVSQQ